MKPELAGKRVRCKCGEILTVPAVALQPAPEVEIPFLLPEADPPQPPVVSAAQPTLDYAVAHTRPQDRPGILMAIGIISILIATVSVLASTTTALIWWRSYAGSVPPLAPSAPAPLGPVSFPPYAGLTTRLGGLGATVRARVVAAAPIDGPFAADRRMMLDRLLAEAGVTVLPSPDTDALQPIAASDNVQLRDPKVRIGLKSPAGRIYLGNNTANFMSSRHGPIQITGDVISMQGNSGLGDHWCVLAIDRRMAQLRAALPAMTAMQAAFVAKQLADRSGPGWYGVMDTGEIMPQIPISQAQIGPGNILSIALGKISYWVMPDGRGIDKDHEPLGLDPATGRPLTVPVVNFKPLLPGNYRIMLALFIYCLLVIVLAFFLAIAGVRILVRPAAGVQMHLWFAVLKLICVATEVALSMSFFASIPPAGGGRAAPGTFNMNAGVSGLISTVCLQCIYPLALLVVFASAQNVRRYLDQQNGFIGLVSPAFRKRWGSLTNPLPMRALFGIVALACLALAVLDLLQGSNNFSSAIPTDVIAIVLGMTLSALPCVWIAARPGEGEA